MASLLLVILVDDDDHDKDSNDYSTIVDSTGLVVVVVALVGSMVVVGRFPFVCVSVVVIVGLVRSSRKGISLSRSDFCFFPEKQNRGSLLISIGYFFGRVCKNEFRFDF